MSAGGARRRFLLAVAALSVAALPIVIARPVAAGTLAPEIERALASSTYVYIATERKDGGFGSPAEIWFMWDHGAVWVASPPTTWRVKRIRAGRALARIAVGSKDGPIFTAKGSLVRDPAVYDRLFATYAKKYPDGWPKYESRFRSGLQDGSRVLVRYEPVGAAATVGIPPTVGAAATVSAAPASPRPSPRP